MESELTDAKHELLKIREMLEMAEKVINLYTYMMTFIRHTGRCNIRHEKTHNTIIRIFTG